VDVLKVVERITLLTTNCPNDYYHCMWSRLRWIQNYKCSRSCKVRWYKLHTGCIRHCSQDIHPRLSIITCHQCYIISLKVQMPHEWLLRNFQTLLSVITALI